MVFDELEVGMDLSTRGFTSGIDDAEDETSTLTRTATQLSAASNRAASGLDEMAGEATQTAATSSLAASRVDALGDQLAQTARRAGAAATGVTAYSGATSGAAGASATWSAVMSASLVPALGALSLTLGPLVATLGAVAAGAGALATAFGTVVGSGFLAYGRQLASTMPEVTKPTEALAKRFGQLRSEIADIIAPLGRQFVPLIKDALNALPDLVRAVVNSLGPLDRFAQTLRRLGQRAMDVIPQITAAFFDLSRRALPVFQDFVGFVGDRGPAAFGMLVNAFRATRDEFARLLGATVSALPPLLELGTTVSQILVPALTTAIGAVGRAVDRFNSLPQPIRQGAVAAGALGSAFVVAVPAVTAITGAISALLGPLGAVALAISALAGAWVADIGNMQAQTKRVFGVIQDEITATMQTLDSVTGGALGRLGDTIRGFVTQARTNLDGIVRFIANTFIAGIRALGDTVRRVLRQAGTIWAAHGDKVTGIIRRLTDVITQDPKQALALLATTIVPGPLATIVAAFRDNWNKVKATVRTALNTIESVARTTMQSFKKQILEPARNTESEFRTNLNQMLTEGRQTFNTIRDIVGRIMRTVLTNIQERLRAMKRIWKANLSGSDGILANARTAFNSLWNNIIKPTLELIQSGWRLFGDDIIRILDGVLGTLNVLAETGMDLLLTTINVILDLISGDWEGAWNNIKDFFERTWNRISEWAKTDGKQLLSGALNIIIDAAKAIFNAFYDWLIGNSFFPDLIGDVASWLESTGKSLVTGAFDAIVGGIESALNSIDLSGIQDAIQNIIDKASDAIDTVTSIPNNVTTTITREINEVTGGGGGGGGGDDDDDGGGGGVPGTSEDSFDVDVDDWVGDDDGGDSGSDLYGGDTPPGFAHGGLIQGEGLAMLHPNEAVMGVEAGAEAIVDAMDGGGGGDTYHFDIDVEGSDMSEQDLIRAIKQDLTRELRRLETR